MVKVSFNDINTSRLDSLYFRPALEDEVQEQIKKLQEELHEEEQGVEAMTNELQVLQESVEPLSAGPLQTTESKTGENTTLPMDDEVHQQELNSNQDNKATHGRASAHTSNTDPAGTAESTNIEVNGLTVTINKDPRKLYSNNKILNLTYRDRTHTLVESLDQFYAHHKS